MFAKYYKKNPAGTATCCLCPHHCQLRTNQSGRCRTRYYDGEKVWALNYGQCTSAALDPIEKKPLARFHPGSLILSLGSWGCNFSCPFCQNWQISQQAASYRELTPEQAAALAKAYTAQGNIGLAYTYNEPSLSFEFIQAAAPLVKEAGLYNVLVSNGYLEEAPLRELLPYIDAWNIDLKGFSEAFYQKMCGAHLAPVLRTIRLAAAVSHVEVTTLIIPGENDDLQEMEEEARWLASIRPDIVLHLTRYFPRYKMTTPPTARETLIRLRDVAQKYLAYVYLGNV